MADTGIVQGLFGLTPQQVQQQEYSQQQALADRAYNSAAGTPGQLMAQGYSQMGSSLGDMGAGMMGTESAAVTQARQQQQAMGQIAGMSVDQLRQYALTIPDPRMKMGVMAYADQKEAQQATLAQQTAKTNLEDMQAIKAANAPSGSDTMQQFAEWKKTNPNGTIVDFRKAVEKDQYEKISPVSGQTPDGKQVYYTDTGQQFTIENNKRVPYSGKIITPAGMRISMQQPVSSEEDKASYISAIANHEKPFPNRYELSKTGISPMSLVAQIKKENPNWNESDFANVKKSEQSFATGKQGDSVRFLGTANRHLDTVSSLGEALNSGDIQIANKARASWLTNTGSSLPTNLDAASSIVAGEIVKSVVGGISAEKDREKATNILSSAKSWNQLKDAIATVKNLLNGQEIGLMQQYKRSTKKSKSYDMNTFRQQMYDQGNTEDATGNAVVANPTPVVANPTPVSLDAYLKSKGH